jgi:hypothetical protein
MLRETSSRIASLSKESTALTALCNADFGLLKLTFKINVYRRETSLAIAIPIPTVPIVHTPITARAMTTVRKGTRLFRLQQIRTGTHFRIRICHWNVAPYWWHVELTPMFYAVKTKNSITFRL